MSDSAASKSVQLFHTCLVNEIDPDVGMAVVHVLERAGVVVNVPPDQTCCGQPAYNAGFNDEARQVARHNVTINGLLPGPFLTDRLRSGIEFEARRQNISFEEMLAKRSATNPTGRVGDPAEFGAACAFLCAASSGFIVGQNLLLDGGAFNSTMG